MKTQTMVTLSMVVAATTYGSDKSDFRSKETKMKKLVSIAAILMCSAVAAWGAPPNPLLGNWKLVPATSRGYESCATSMVFTSTTQTLTHAGKPATEKVNYVAAQTAVYPTTVYVTGNTYVSTHTTYNFPSKDKVVLSTAAACTYQRD